MSILIQFLSDNIVLVVLTIIAAAVLIISVVALIVMAVHRRITSVRSRSENHANDTGGGNVKTE